MVFAQQRSRPSARVSDNEPFSNFEQTRVIDIWMNVGSRSAVFALTEKGHVMRYPLRACMYLAIRFAAPVSRFNILQR